MDTAIGGTLLFLFCVFLFVLAVLWVLLPFAVFKMRRLAIGNRSSIENMEAAINDKARQIDKLAEIAETEHQMKMVAMKAKRATQQGKG